ncbi:hypothetical protein PVK06_009177 [Gossypium arboreum]|uniref:Transposase MuDR plant domain-containing protein n=1 Tax=Gossypium arboreum TaxID=29729 RepID=A0ABR0QLT6_GOSAR|nr:hypothetical protein PVK06_009177 [Gossypium arboreum]
MEYTTPARHSISGWDIHIDGSMFDARNMYWEMTSTSSGLQSTSDWGCYQTSIRRDDVLPTTSTHEGTLYIVDDEPKDVEAGADEEEKDLRFRAYSPPAHMHNVYISADDALEFPELPHKRHDRTSSSLDSGELEVGKEFSSKNSFLGALKQHCINHGVNYNMVKSKSEKFEAKCAVQDDTCSWKIMASVKKKTDLWEIKKYKGVSQDYLKIDSSIIASLILSMVLEKYVPGCITDLEMSPAYYNDRLLRGCQVFKCLFSSFKQRRDAFLYCKLLIQIDGTFMYGRYTHRLFLAVAQDDGGRILPIAFAITPGELGDD